MAAWGGVTLRRGGPAVLELRSKFIAGTSGGCVNTQTRRRQYLAASAVRLSSRLACISADELLCVSDSDAPASAESTPKHLADGNGIREATIAPAQHSMIRPVTAWHSMATCRIMIPLFQGSLVQLLSCCYEYRAAVC